MESRFNARTTWQTEVAVRSGAEADTKILFDLCGHSRKAEAHHNIIFEHDLIGECYIVQRGWIFSYRLLPNGSRQIINFYLPGDVVGISNFVCQKSSVSLECLNEVIYLPIAFSAVKREMLIDTRVAKAFLSINYKENSIIIEHLVNTGRRNALSRTAHLVLELSARLSNIGVRTDEEFELPLSQNLIADALGLTPIHVNRIIRQLREDKLMTFRSGLVSIKDRSGLEDLASFSPDYLMLES